MFLTILAIVPVVIGGIALITLAVIHYVDAGLKEFFIDCAIISIPTALVAWLAWGITHLTT